MSTPTELDRWTTATAHADANPRKKRTAMLNGVTPRTERRWRHFDTAHMGPLGRWCDYLENAENPYRIHSRIMAEIMRKRLAKLTRDEIILRIRELHALDAVQEGVDNANRARRGLAWRDRAVDSERDAAHDLELAALYLRAEELGLTEQEVFGA